MKELFDTVLIAVALSMDAFSVSVVYGIGVKKINIKGIFLIALFFGGFQLFMPLLGWLLGSSIKTTFIHYSNFIVFLILFLIGAKMIWESFKMKENEQKNKINLTELFILAIATSIDAFSIGIGFAFIQIHLLTDVVIIGIITFLFSIAGTVIGKQLGNTIEIRLEFIGGIVLILLGFKHLLL